MEPFKNLLDEVDKVQAAYDQSKPKLAPPPGLVMPHNRVIELRHGLDRQAKGKQRLPPGVLLAQRIPPSLPMAAPLGNPVPNVEHFAPASPSLAHSAWKMSSLPLTVWPDSVLERESGEEVANNVNGYSRQGFSRPGNKGKNQQDSGNSSPGTTPYQSTSSLAPRVPPLPSSPSFAQSLSGATSLDDTTDEKQGTQVKIKDPIWFQEKWTRQVVKGNFMTIVARPKIIEDGEWIAHQVSEMHRMLSVFTKVVVDLEDSNACVCNPQTCPSMSAGIHTYTWLNDTRQPMKLAAPQYINLVMKWVVAKLSDPKSFPTDQNTVFASGSYPSGGLDSPSANIPIPAGPTTINAPLSALSGRSWVGKMSGFPETHLQDCKIMVRQMFRVYAHLYWAHFVDFYHMKMETSLNSAFTYFIFFVREFDLLTPTDLEPMQRLIDIWVQAGYLTDKANASGSVTYVTSPQT